MQSLEINQCGFTQALHRNGNATKQMIKNIEYTLRQFYPEEAFPGICQGFLTEIISWSKTRFFHIIIDVDLSYCGNEIPLICNCVNLRAETKCCWQLPKACCFIGRRKRCTKVCGALKRDVRAVRQRAWVSHLRRRRLWNLRKRLFSSWIYPILLATALLTLLLSMVPNGLFALPIPLWPTWFIKAITVLQVTLERPECCQTHEYRLSLHTRHFSSAEYFSGTTCPQRRWLYPLVWKRLIALHFL